jgi:hypothetical protein
MTDTYIRKSMLESYEFCPQQFFKQWVMDASKEPNQKMLIGTRFHDWAEKFFDYAGTFNPEDWIQFIPEEFNDEEVEMANWFIDYQKSRWNQLCLEDRLEEFIPLYRELFMICDAIRIKSTLDGAEWTDKKAGTIRLVEYKTGGKLDEDTAFRQLAFYAVLWEASGNPGTITTLRLVNPRLKMVVDCDYTEDLKITALKRVAKLRNAIDKSDFPYKCSDGKFAACKLCNMNELPKLFPDDGMRRFSDIYE